ncbi:MAG: hypothetical protein M1833_006309 [Piccolia ochrophora]|nr:MAG: hypothetical protein M1833_006309 [Piccolia ochrophora]
MSDLLRDTALGQLIRFVTRNKVLLYPEERADFQCPSCYDHSAKPELASAATPASEKTVEANPTDAERPVVDTLISEDSIAVQKAATNDSALTASSRSSVVQNDLGRIDTRVDLEKIQTRAELEQAYSRATMTKRPTRPVVPDKLADGTILVDWYTTDDPANPQNWSSRRKLFVALTLDWRWSLWELLWAAAPIFLLLFAGLPETSASNILLRRANRLRKKTGNENLKSQSEIDQAHMQASGILLDYLYKPFQMMLLDPAIGFTDFYTSLVYGIFYSFFEAFPIVFLEYYHFNFGQMGLTFLCITVATAISIPVYIYYLYYIIEPRLKTRGLGEPEERLIPALVSSLLVPVGLFIFASYQSAWTARESIHWIVPIIGVAIYIIGVFIVLQCIFIYLPLCYPSHAASLLAGNDFVRSAVAFAAILFAHPLFIKLGIGAGTSLLAAFTVVCIGGVYALYFFGANLRARSRYTAK